MVNRRAGSGSKMNCGECVGGPAMQVGKLGRGMRCDTRLHKYEEPIAESKYKFLPSLCFLIGPPSTHRHTGTLVLPLCFRNTTYTHRVIPPASLGFPIIFSWLLTTVAHHSFITKIPPDRVLPPSSIPHNGRKLGI